MLVEKSRGSVTIKSINYELFKRTLAEIKQILFAECPEVQKIILFGSFARGDYTPESDIDLCVIVNRSSLPFLQRSDPYLPFFQDIPLDVNLLVYTQEEITRMMNEGNELIKEILHTGIEL